MYCEYIVLSLYGFKSNMKGLNNLNILKLIYIVLRVKISNKSKNIYVLFPNETNLNGILTFLPLYLSIYKAGYKIGIYLSLRSIHLIPIYLLLGVSKFHPLINFRLPSLRFTDFKQIFDYRKYLYPSIMNLYKLESIEAVTNNEEIISNLEKKVTNLLNNFANINFKKVNAVFFTDYIYLPQGPILDFLNRYYPNINLLHFQVGHISDSLVINKIESNVNNRHPFSPPLKLYEKNLNSLNPTEKKEIIQKTITNLKKFYTEKKWFNYVGTSLYQDGKFSKKVNKSIINKENSTFAIFPHIYWDSSSAAGDDLFKNYRDWFESTVEYILKNTASKIIVKDHPSNLYKLSIVGKQYLSPIKSFIDKLLPDFKDRITYYPPETKTSTLVLIEAADYIMTVRGTVGVEACLLNKEVIFAGSGRFNGYKFGMFPSTKKEYFSSIQKASRKEIYTKNNNLYAAVYLDTLWNQMTFYQDFVKSKYRENELNSKKNIICVNMNIINKQIDRLAEWFLSPTATYTNYD